MAGETELFFSLYEDDLGGTRPDRFAGVGPQERVQRHAVVQNIVPSVDVPRLHMVEQLVGAVCEPFPLPHKVVQLVESEEDETELYSQRAKLLRYQDDVRKERGLGDAKLLMHKKTCKVRRLLRQENTRTVVCNFYVMSVASFCELEACPNSDRTLLFAAHDCSEGGPQAVQLALVFAAKKLAVKFRDAFEEAKTLKWPRGRW